MRCVFSVRMVSQPAGTETKILQPLKLWGLLGQQNSMAALICTVQARTISYKWLYNMGLYIRWMGIITVLYRQRAKTVECRTLRHLLVATVCHITYDIWLCVKLPYTYIIAASSPWYPMWSNRRSKEVYYCVTTSDFPTDWMIRWLSNWFSKAKNRWFFTLILGDFPGCQGATLAISLMDSTCTGPARVDIELYIKR